MNHDTHHQSHGRHGLLMVLCCLIPLVILGIVYSLEVPLGGIARTAILLLCPLSHIVMMLAMRGRGIMAQEPTTHSTPRYVDQARSEMGE